MRSRAPGFRALFPSSADGARRARKRVVDFATRWLCGEDLIDLELACGEALANCVEHGRGPLLTVDCSNQNGTLITEIRQHSGSFAAPQAVVAPPQGASRGYGLYIMHQVLDGIEFLEDGEGLRLLKKLRQA